MARRRRVAPEHLAEAMAYLRSRRHGVASAPEVSRAISELGVPGGYASPDAVRDALAAYGWAKAGRGTWLTSGKRAVPEHREGHARAPEDEAARVRPRDAREHGADEGPAEEEEGPPHEAPPPRA